MTARILPALAVLSLATPALAQPGGPAEPGQDGDLLVLRWVAAVALLGALGTIALLALLRGRVRVAGGLTGRTIRRFGAFERLVHWMTAASFLALALSGLVLSFGDALLRPAIGAEAFAMLARAGHWAHRHLGVPFLLGVLLMALLWSRESLPAARDRARPGTAGGARRQAAAGRFRPGQKLLVWLTVLGGLLAAGSGLLLLPAFAGLAPAPPLRTLHAGTGLVMLGAMIVHGWRRSAGMEGAFAAMGSGEVDLAWAKQHHPAWVEEELRQARATVAGPSAPKRAGAR
jgi:formate dehydrogenase subunit gamma